VKNKININKLLNENGYAYGQSPWDFLLEEAKVQEVNSDDETQQDDKSSGKDDASDTQDTSDEEPKLSDDELQDLVKELQQSDDMDGDIKKLLDNGSINQADVNLIGELLQNNQPNSPEEEQEMQINNIQEMVIRFSIYDKLNNLENKLELFIDNFPNVDKEFYKDVSQIHEYIKVVNTLIFNLEINLVYQLYANLEMKLIDLFKNYKETLPNQLKG